MLLYDSRAHLSFQQFGISIPSLDSRKTRTLSSLTEHPLLKKTKEQWLIDQVEISINQLDLERAHQSEYVAGFYNNNLKQTLLTAYELIDSEGKFHRYDPSIAKKPLTDLFQGILRIISGTYSAINIAKEKGFCYFLGGGMHHGHGNFGHGFCPLNDIAVSLLKARSEGNIKSAWIIDLDAHRGDGTAEILSEEKDFKTLSIHMERGWPLDSPRLKSDGSLNPGWFPGDIDIPIDVGEEEFYIPRLKEAMNHLKMGEKPDIALVLAGADPYEKDELPSTSLMRMSREQLLERDQMIYSLLDDLEIPSAWVAAGGYGPRSWEIHSQFLRWVLPQRLTPEI